MERKNVCETSIDLLVLCIGFTTAGIIFGILAYLHVSDLAPLICGCVLCLLMGTCLGLLTRLDNLNPRI